MNRGMERLLVDTFVVPGKKERVIYELNRPDRRWECMAKMQKMFINGCVCRLNGIRSWEIEDNVEAVRRLGARGEAYWMRREADLCRITGWEDAVRLAAETADGYAFIPEAKLCFYVGEDYRYTKYCLCAERRG